MKLLRGTLKVVVALFCIWHMAATFTYALYHVDEVPILGWLTSKRSYTRPYVLTTSQWQRWNLFSPDPLRRVIEMRFEAERDNTWITLRTLNEHNVNWWQRAPELKMMRRMENDKMEPLRVQYMHDMCRYMDLPPGTPMRLYKRWQVIPKHDTTHTTEWWNNWEPEWNEFLNTETRCPTLS